MEISEAARELGDRIRGRGRFVADLSIGAPAWLRVVRSTVPHGHIRAVDVSRALSVDGVLLVLTAMDLEPGIPRLPIRMLKTERMAGRLQPALANGRVRYVGEPVAVIVAQNQAVAEDAAELVRIEIDALDAVVETRPDPPEAPLWDDGDSNELCVYASRPGPPGQDLCRGPTLVMSTGRQTGLPLETRGLYASWTGDRLDIWGITKYVHSSRRELALVFGIDVGDVVVHHVDVGGMFGPRGELYPEDILVPWAARLTGCPVAWIEDRFEHLIAINHSRDQVHQIRIDTREDGLFATLSDVAYVDFGAYPRGTGGLMAQHTAESLPGPYRWESVNVDVRGRASNRTPVGTMRGPAEYEATLAREWCIEKTADYLGDDPLDLRLRNLLKVEDFPYRPPFAEDFVATTYDTGNYRAVAERFLSDTDYRRRRDAIRQRQAAGELAGIGIAMYCVHSGYGVEESISLTLTDEGRLVVGTSVTEFGQGILTMIRRVVSEVLPFRASDIDIESGSSDAHGEGNGSFSSRSAIFVASALHDAAARLLTEVRSRAARILDRRPDDLVASYEGMQSDGGDGAVVAWKLLGPTRVAGRHESPDPTVGFGLATATVSIDVETGGIACEELDVGYDCGHAFDLEGVRRQLTGAAAQSIGGILFEHLAYDGAGQPLVVRLQDYHVPTAMVVPPVTAHVYTTTQTSTNPSGARGAGEAGIVGTGAAVVAAVLDALPAAAHEHVTSLPLYSEKILEALETIGYYQT